MDLFGWIRGKRFDAPAPPLRDYWVTAKVTLSSPLPVEGGEDAVGYFRILGLRCTPLRLRSFLEEQVPDGSIVRGESTHWHEVSLNQLSRSLRRSIHPESAESVWHASGHIYYPADDRTAEAADESG